MSKTPETDHANDFHCATHGWWNPMLESGCPHCVAMMRAAICSLESRLAEANERADRLQKSARFLSKELCDFEATGVSYPARLDAAWRRLTVDIEAIDAARGKK